MTTAASTEPGHYGAATTRQLMLREATIAVAWNIQGDPARVALVDEMQRLFALSLPGVPNTAVSSEALTLLWLGPRSWLLIASEPISSTHPLGASISSTHPLGASISSTHPSVSYSVARDALNFAGAALFDVSASRVGWMIGGPRAATLLAKGCPLDLHPRTFPVGGCAQSLFGHVNALVWKHADDAFTMLVARSFERDVWSELCDASAQYGYDVLPPAPFGSDRQ